MLNVTDLFAGYGDVRVLEGVSLSVRPGEVVALLGSNGAGKTTALRTISGLLKPSAGAITFNGTDLVRTPAHHLPDLGIAHVPQGRGVFQTLTVLENLQVGAYSARAKASRQSTMESVFALFPILRERQTQEARTLSGGEQQMLAVARALMLRPTLLMLDEPSLGLAPVVVETLFPKISEIAGTGVGVLLVEQNVMQSLSVARRGYVLERGKIVIDGDAEDLRTNECVREAYLGL